MSSAGGSGTGRKKVVAKKTGVTTKYRKKSPAAQLNHLLQKEKVANDVVIKEFPVYLSKTLADSLTLIQYPQRPCSVSTQNMDILETKIKPGQKKLQITLGLDPESELYDPESGELLAEAAHGVGLDEDEYMPDHRLRLEQTVLESTEVPKLTEMSRYAIGVLRKGILTLTPLKTIVQMKPVYPHLNSADKARSAHARAKAGDPPEVEDEEAEKVTLKFSRTTANSAAAGGGRATSSFLQRKREEEEPWVELEYVRNDVAEFDKLFTTAEAEEPFYVLNKTEYLKDLFPRQFEATGAGDGIGDDKAKDKKNPRISLVQMRTMQIPEQLRVLLASAQVLQYNQIVDFLRTKLSSECDDVSLLKAIQLVAILVQGCWVVKSEILYDPEYKSGVNGISGGMMTRGRDAILSQFTEHRYVDRRRMTVLTKLPPEEVSEILGQVSVLVRGKGWEFMLPYDTNFLGKYPEVVERQGLIWQMKKQQRIRQSSTGDSGGGGGGGSPPRRRKSRTKSISSSGDEEGGEAGGRARRQSEGGSGRQRRNSRTNVVGSKIET